MRYDAGIFIVIGICAIYLHIPRQCTYLLQQGFVKTLLVHWSYSLLSSAFPAYLQKQLSARSKLGLCVCVLKTKQVIAYLYRFVSRKVGRGRSDQINLYRYIGGKLLFISELAQGNTYALDDESHTHPSPPTTSLDKKKLCGKGLVALHQV